MKGNDTNITIQNNTVADNPGAAVRIDNNALGTGTNSGFVVTGNNFYSNVAGGMIVGAGQYTGTLTATGNYWGSASGPAINGVGTGDALFSGGNNVVYSPFSAAMISGAGPVTPPANPTPASGIQSSITTNFNAGSSTNATGNYLSFNAVLKPTFSGTGPVTISFVQTTVTIQLANGSTITATAPNSIIHFSSATTVATTSYDSASNTWTTNLPISGTSGNDFLDGFAFKLPAGVSQNSLKGATWNGTFQTDSTSLSLNWQFAVSVYNSHFLDAGYTALGVKASDDSHATPYNNSDHAGTPELALSDFVGNGGTWGGGSNFTGSYSATGSLKVPPISIPPVTPPTTPTSPTSPTSPTTPVTPPTTPPMSCTQKFNRDELQRWIVFHRSGELPLVQCGAEADLLGLRTVHDQHGRRHHPAPIDQRFDGDRDRTERRHSFFAHDDSCDDLLQQF